MKNTRTRLTLITLAVLTATVSFRCEDREFEPSRPGLLVPKTVAEDASLPQISANGTRLHAETYGDLNDPMVVMLHGGPGGDYRSMLNGRDLADDGYFVVFYDQRGSGLSQRHPKKSYTVDIMIDDLDAVIKHYRTSPDQKVFLFGHSWGAMLATAYINRHPESIDGAILAEPGGFTWPDAKDYISRSRHHNVLSEDVSDVFYHDQIFTGKENDHEILDYKMALSTAHHNSKGNKTGDAGPSPSWRQGAVVQLALFEIAEDDGFDFTTHLSQYDTKVLFVYSELSKAYGSQYAQHLASSYPQVQLEMIEGTGHEMLYFGWNNLYPIVKTYLNETK